MIPAVEMSIQSGMNGFKWDLYTYIYIYIYIYIRILYIYIHMYIQICIYLYTYIVRRYVSICVAAMYPDEIGLT